MSCKRIACIHLLNLILSILHKVIIILSRLSLVHNSRVMFALSLVLWVGTIPKPVRVVKGLRLFDFSWINLRGIFVFECTFQKL